jgi:carbamate kinase
VATVITQIQVAPNDPALEAPTKFIGHAIPDARVESLRERGVSVSRDSRGRWRRVVGSPTPLAVHEIGVIKRLVQNGTIVVACGGGGAPIYHDGARGWEGVDAVVDKDLAAAVLARDLGASLLMILTDVDGVFLDYGTPQQRMLDTLTLAEAERLDKSGAFGAGSMAPKVRAAANFVRHTGGRAIITELARGREAVRGAAGTTIIAENA